MTFFFAECMFKCYAVANQNTLHSLIDQYMARTVQIPIAKVQGEDEDTGHN